MATDVTGDGLDKLAVPISLSRPDGLDRVAALASEADVVGIGEPSHGDADSLRVKLAVLQSLRRCGKQMILAWERGPAQIVFIKRRMSDRNGLAPEDRAWLYPWVSREMDEILSWIASAQRNGWPELHFVGIDMDNPGPPAPYLDLADRYGPFGAGVARTIGVYTARSSRPIRVSSDELHRVIEAGETFLARAQASLDDAMIVRAAIQWAHYRLLLEGGIEASETAYAYRDRSIAENLIAWRNGLGADLSILSAHNGHVSRDAWMAGGHLGASLGTGYIAIGSAFATGRFNACRPLPGGGFDRTMVAFDAEAPPAGSLEHRLAKSGLPPALIDLRPLREGGHWLAQPQRIREVSLAGDRDQFVMTRTPSDLYDALLWLDRIDPSTLLDRVEM